MNRNRKRVAALLTALLALCMPLGGCTDVPEDDPYYYRTEATDDQTETTELTTTTTAFTRPTFPDHYNTETASTADQTDDTGAETTTAAESTQTTSETTESTARPTGDPTDEADATTTTTAATEPMEDGKYLYTLSSLRSARVACNIRIDDYITEDEGVLSVNLRRLAEAAGYRSSGEHAYQRTVNGQSITVQIDGELPVSEPESKTPLRTITCTTDGDTDAQTLVFVQEAPERAVYTLSGEEKTVTRDQIILLTFLMEQKAENPAEDPLEFIIPSYFSSQTAEGTEYQIP